MNEFSGQSISLECIRSFISLISSHFSIAYQGPGHSLDTAPPLSPSGCCSTSSSGEHPRPFPSQQRDIIFPRVSKDQARGLLPDGHLLREAAWRHPGPGAEPPQLWLLSMWRRSSCKLSLSQMLGLLIQSPSPAKMQKNLI